MLCCPRTFGPFDLFFSLDRFDAVEEAKKALDHMNGHILDGSDPTNPHPLVSTLPHVRLIISSRLLNLIFTLQLNSLRVSLKR